jgi:hypothetical protein
MVPGTVAIPLLALMLAVPAGVSNSAERAPIEVRTVQDLRFGQLAKASSAPGAVRIDPRTGDRQLSGDVYGLGGDYGFAEFELLGEPGAEYQIVLPSRFHLGGGRTIVELVAHPGLTGTFELDGRTTVRVGGTLDLAPVIESGHHDVLFTVCVEYLWPTVGAQDL